MDVLPSERLTFSLMDASDAPLMFELDQDPEVMHFISGGKTTSYDDVLQVFLPRLAQYRNPTKGWGLWKVVESASDEFIGWVLVRPMAFFSADRDDSDLELGWRFKRAAWGKGYATEAARQIMMTISQTTAVTKFSALAVEDNHASINIMTKLGMRFEKKALHKDPLGDMDVVYYRLNMNKSTD
ncbi:N-acetyltransferase [Corallincola holothuriorum]|uniref:N-acetyltransferase n=1 Tax=Corallincola holothuriorum TaxID=2282215 RepID=A0A368NMZ8_9GAMM|nr:GNAT family N-acetyltransferase [Corallincola holothuriorum]RCU51460.1 N-acetyltransferase [Corallincola holothuriorum]